jgi:hypothetical protein
MLAVTSVQEEVGGLLKKIEQPQRKDFCIQDLGGLFQ